MNARQKEPSDHDKEKENVTPKDVSLPLLKSRKAAEEGDAAHTICFCGDPERLSIRATRKPAGRPGSAGGRELFERAPSWVRTQAHFPEFGSR